ncbi:MAG: sporulation membrane protein YtaF [Syntrophomonadaceae bacterium]|nr:sporulation membrane protein YtaF [Syntrophomonadaceae bacterium]
MDALWILLFGLAVSVDGLMAGVAYGIRKVSVPWPSLLIIAATSSLLLTVSMVSGKALGMFMEPEMAVELGAALLIILGCYFFALALKENVQTWDSASDGLLFSFNIKPAGIIIRIMKEPLAADFDSSGEINYKEAVFLGLALAADVLGAGIGLAMAGFNILYVVAAVGILTFFLVKSGVFIGEKITGSRLKKFTMILPGIIFVIIGIFEFI